MPPAMHPDEVDTSPAIVHHLLQSQFSYWVDLPVSPVASAGTDHALYRLGDDMLLRLPRIAAAAEQVHKEQAYLPKLAPVLPLAIPEPLELGEPDAHYPYPWSVYGWLEGETMHDSLLANSKLTARKLAGFLYSLHHANSRGGPKPGAHNFFRGVPLQDRDSQTRDALQQLAPILSAHTSHQLLAIWEKALLLPRCKSKESCWIHGDLHPGNLLIDEGALWAVIDFGGLAVADPACDLIIAWNFFSATIRQQFRAMLRYDDATWERGRAWALSTAAIALPYYQHSNPTLAASARYTLQAVLQDEADA